MDPEQEGAIKVWIMSVRGHGEVMDCESEGSIKVWIMSETGRQKYGL